MRTADRHLHTAWPTTARDSQLLRFGGLISLPSVLNDGGVWAGEAAASASAPARARSSSAGKQVGQRDGPLRVLSLRSLVSSSMSKVFTNGFLPRRRVLSPDKVAGRIPDHAIAGLAPHPDRQQNGNLIAWSARGYCVRMVRISPGSSTTGPFAGPPEGLMQSYAAAGSLRASHDMMSRRCTRSSLGFPARAPD